MPGRACEGFGDGERDAGPKWLIPAGRSVQTCSITCTRAPSFRRPRLLKAFSRGNAVLLQRSSHSVAHGMIRSISASKRRIDLNNLLYFPRKNPASALDIQAMAFVLPSYELLTIQNCASLTDKLIPGLTLPTTTGDCGKAQPSSEPDDHISSETPPQDLASLRLSRGFVCFIQCVKLFPCSLPILSSARADFSFTDYYTINAVGQDDFADVKVPDEPRKPAQAK